MVALKDTLRPSAQFPRMLSGHAMLNGHLVEFYVDPDDQSSEEAINFAERVVGSLEHLSAAGRRVAAQDLLESYNNSWRAYQVAGEDGKLETIVSPSLSSAEFESKLILESVSTTGTSCLELCFEDSNLFWGHKVIVKSFEGVEFSDAFAELLG